MILGKKKKKKTYCFVVFFLENTDNHKDIREIIGKSEMNNNVCVYVHF